MWRQTAPTALADAQFAASPRSLRTSRWTIAIATTLFVLVLCRWRPWDLFARGGFSTDFYDEQARSLLHGRIDVRPGIPGPEGFLIDGKTYLYYGPLLSLVRLPFALFGQLFTGRLVRLSMTVGFVALLTAAFHLAELARQWATGIWPDRNRDVWWRTPLFVAAVACSPVLFLAGWVSVYHETELWAAAFGVWAIVAALRCWNGPSRRSAIMAGVAASAATLTRAPVGFGATVGLVLIGLLLWRRARTRSVEMVGVAATGVVVHLAVNVAKFGSLFGLPGGRQLLSLQDASRAAWFAGNHESFFSLRFLPTTLAQYLRPDTVRFERLAPFIRFGPLAPDYGSYPLETSSPSASLTASATLLLLAGLAGTVIVLRRRAWPWTALLIGAAVAAAPSFIIGFVANRYLVDMLPMLMVPGAIAIAAIPMPGRRATRRLAQTAVGSLVVWGTWCNVSLAIWVQNLKEPGFTAWRYQLDDQLFGNPAPGLIGFDPGLPVPRDGVVAVDESATGGCIAVYIAEQGSWVALERAQGMLQLTGRFVFDPAGETALVEGTDEAGASWTIVAVADGSGPMRFELRTGEATVTGAPVTQAGSTVAVRIIADPVTKELSVTADGHLALFSFAVPPGTMIPSSSFTVISDRNETLCRQLQRRR